MSGKQTENNELEMTGGAGEGLPRHQVAVGGPTSESVDHRHPALPIAVVAFHAGWVEARGPVLKQVEETLKLTRTRRARGNGTPRQWEIVRHRW